MSSILQVLRWPLQAGFACGTMVPCIIYYSFFALAEREKRITKKKKYRSAEGYAGFQYATA